MELMHFCLWLDSTLYRWKWQITSLQQVPANCFFPCCRLYISHFLVYEMDVCWLGCSPYPTLSLHDGFTFWIILYSFWFFSTGFGCLPWHFPDLSPSKATCPRTVPFRSSFLFYSGPGWKERLFYHFIRTYSAVFFSIVVLVERRGSCTIL